MNNLFYELIRIAIGTQDSFSRLPAQTEWKDLYDMAKKQSILGVCFAALKRLGADADEGCARVGISEMLFFKWMGVAAKIQYRNQTVDKQCVTLQKLLATEGSRSCILKGQGVGQLYAEHLRGLRQCGDIDVWVEGGLNAVLRLTEKYGIKPVVAEHHVELPVFEDTEVEAHFTPTYMRCPWHNRRLQKWMVFEDCISKEKNRLGMVVPTTEFNLVFLLLHAYRHMTSEGVGIRQVMDYYFVLHEAQTKGSNGINVDVVSSVLKSLGVMKFAGAMMYVLQEVFGMKREELLCKPNEKEGRYLLNEIMTGGNFGHYDDRVKVVANESKIARFIRQTNRNIHQLTHYPTEAIFSPWWRAKIWVWRKRKGWI